VELEEPRALFTKLAGAGIGVKKLQLSAGLRVPQVDDAALAKLAAFSDDVYLHQTVERRAETLTRYADLPEAIAARNAAPAHAREWRIHFHVPIFHAGFGVLQSTRDFLLEVLALQRAQPISPHLEVETYTWDVLPAELRAREVTEDIARELQFVQRALRGEAVA
jgi:hypothetical protein